ncbi:alpha-2,8-sialyltransferase 8B-like [Acanthaster planci]|uniref:Alpha-2,8-sialyltransferase 8B-like n=1 Tax=Acanthaster planci TaxID=133434 RepID=A0A8B7YQK7_ACAPL|nr:alpha-2,8-sialyltransferase 8B-like [Acanthaster planci]XP_022095553.1 alpha-2,8-sialyltransferase 8B-like [Acanthaster planci]XP_022095554.1 alpha-2,8-sialyltransferase 8B-like [Acanthaster planci]
MRMSLARFCTVVALVSLVVIISLANRHFFGRRYAQDAAVHSVHRSHHPAGMRIGTPPKATPEMIEVPPRDEDNPPTERLIPVSLHCKQVCTSGLGGDCYPIDKAILVYRDDTPTSFMKFRQNAHPVLYVSKPADGQTVPEFQEVEECDMDDHFPDMFLLPRQRQCAVVGNSGILLGSGCGKAIDGHDFILRANLAPVKGYETDVGQHTDMTAINWETLGRLYSSVVQSGPTNLDNRILLERIHRLQKSILWYPKSLSKLYQREVIRKLAVTLKDHKFMNIKMAFGWKAISIEREWGLEGYATLGFDMFVVARTLCSNITLYGFYPSREGPNGEKIQHHYYEDVDFKYQTAKHDFWLEYQKLQDLQAKGEIKIQIKPCKTAD